MMAHYDSPEAPLPEAFGRKYTEAGGHLSTSLKRYINLGKDHDIQPIIKEPSYRMYVTGLSGSGKSFFIAQFVKYNRPKHPFVFLFSPVSNDSSLATIKGLTHLTIEELEKELKREFKVEDLPEGCLVIFDDVESYPKKAAKKYLDLRDQLLERGRHRDISTITVSHNATNGATTKASIRESQYWILFPKFNTRDTKNILKTYGGFSTEEIDQIMHMDSRWVLIKKSIPKYAIGQHEVITY
jgi:hypothetical protein